MQIMIGIPGSHLNAFWDLHLYLKSRLSLGNIFHQTLFHSNPITLETDSDIEISTFSGYYETLRFMHF